MNKEELIAKLNECYTLRDGMKQYNLPIPESLEKAIQCYEVKFRILTLRMHDYHYTVEPNDKAFYETLIEYKPVVTDQVTPVAVGDGWTASAVIIKHDNKYGIFHVPGFNPNWDDEKFLSPLNPFVYEEVRVAPSFSFKHDIGLVAVKRDGKWGVIDMHRDYCYQTIVEMGHNDYELSSLVENKTGILFDGSWEEIDYNIPQNSDSAIAQSSQGVIRLTADNVKEAEGRQLRVTMPDGTVYQEKNSIQTFIKTLQHIGLDRIPQVGIYCSDYNLVDTRQRTTGNKKWQQEVEGKWVYIYFCNPQKVIYLLQIAEYLGLQLRIEAV